MLLSDGDLDDHFIESDVTTPTANYFNNDMRDRMLKHAIEIKFVKDSYTTPVTVEFSSPPKSGDNTTNIDATYWKIFVAMKILEPSVKLTTQHGNAFEHSKYFPTGNEYNTYFPNTTEDLDRFKSTNIFS